MSIATNLMTIQDRIAEAAARANREVGEIQLVAVSKTVDRNMVEAAYAAGVRHFGENRVQDMREKFEQPVGPDSVVHLIGHLQTNKARDAVRYCSIIESVDRTSLVDALQKRCEVDDTTIEILLQVNIAGEEQKFGCDPDDVGALLDHALAQDRLRVRGLMTIAPLEDDVEATRPVFQGLRELRGSLQRSRPSADLSQLSMGMTNDYWIAIEEGATMIRLGRAIFQG
jgi:PLP dependent protein